MAKKIGILSGILLFVLSFFAVLPLGIYFNGGISSYAEIPLYIINYNGISAYFWGTINTSTSTAAWWIDLGASGTLALITVQLMILLACIVTFISSWSKTNRGKLGFMVSLIMMFVALVVIILDLFLSGAYLGIGTVVPAADLLTALGIGFYIFIISIVLNILCVRAFAKTEED